MIFYASYLGEGEGMVAVCHRHVALIIDTVIAGIFFVAFVPAFIYGYNLFGIDMRVKWWMFEGYEFAAYLFIMYRIMSWYNDVLIVTTSGVTDLDWGIFRQHTRAVAYRSIEAIEITEDSAMRIFFNRGDIVVRTNVEGMVLRLLGAHKPHAIQAYIQDTIKKLKSDDAKKNMLPFERLLSTLQDVVRNQLEHDAHPETPPMPDHEENPLSPEELAELAIVEGVLRRRGTIDLREKEKEKSDTPTETKTVSPPSHDPHSH